MGEGVGTGVVAGSNADPARGRGGSVDRSAYSAPSVDRSTYSEASVDRSTYSAQSVDRSAYSPRPVDRSAYSRSGLAADRRRVPAARALLAAFTTLAALTGLLALTAAPAHAAGYRYWSFWKSTGDAWAYQQQGPSVHLPPDGSVDGWRFAVSPDGGRDAARPRTPGDFATICAGTPEQAGRKRVAVVLDFGTPSDADSGNPPEGRTACATVHARATSAEVLATVAPPLRYGTDGLLCAIAGYPRTGCGEQLSGSGAGSGAGAGAGSTAASASTSGPGPGATAGAQVSAADDRTGGGLGPDIGPVAGGALVLAVGAGAVLRNRQRRAGHE
ncbi:SCO2322 family protein [Kitasatospora sp. NPDC054939]